MNWKPTEDYQAKIKELDVDLRMVNQSIKYLDQKIDVFRSDFHRTVTSMQRLIGIYFTITTIALFAIFVKI